MSTLPLLSLLLLSAPRPQAPRETTPVQAPASLPDAEVEARVQSFLGAIDTPIAPSQWQALGPYAVTVLERISADEGTLPTRRALAVDGYVTLAPRGAVTHLTTLAHDPKAPRAVRLSAIRGLGALAPSAELVGLLSPTLADPDRRVLAAAARVLATRNPDAACASIRARAEVEKRRPAALVEALQVCENH